MFDSVIRLNAALQGRYRRIGDKNATTSAYLLMNWFGELRQRMGN